MDLIPKPDQVVAAVGNVVHQVLWGGLADLRPMPRSLVGEGVLRQVFHYRPATGVTAHGDPVLLVAPLAAPPSCYDLRRGCSLVERLVAGGRPTYLVEYGRVSFSDRDLGLDRWVTEVVPEAVREVSAHAGGNAVHLVGWGLGGTFSVLAAADAPDLPLASVTSLGAPFDVSQVPLVAPPKPLLDLDLPDSWRPVTRVLDLIGGAPASLRWAYDVLRSQSYLTTPLALATHLDDAELLAQVEAVQRLMAGTSAYRGRTFGQVYHRFTLGDGHLTGLVPVNGREVPLSRVTAPVLVVAGSTDAIAPVAAVRAVVPWLSSAAEARFEIVPGGHLGLLTGREARTTTWVVLDEWLTQWSGRSVVAPVRRTRKASPKKAAVQKTATKKTATKKTASKGVAPEAGEIGSNPRRRYDSKSSRGLAPRRGS